MKAKIHYVYTHVDPDTDEIVYVGKGSRGRAWAFSSVAEPKGGRYGSRSREHTDWYHEKETQGLHPGDLVRIVKVFSTSKEALTYEKELIDRYDPVFNGVTGNPTICTKEQATAIAQFREDGMSYADIGNVFGRATMTIHRWHNGQVKSLNKLMEDLV